MISATVPFRGYSLTAPDFEAITFDACLIEDVSIRPDRVTITMSGIGLPAANGSGGHEVCSGTLIFHEVTRSERFIALLDETGSKFNGEQHLLDGPFVPTGAEQSSFALTAKLRHPYSFVEWEIRAARAELRLADERKAANGRLNGAGSVVA
jgi:hypothetical protein